MTLRADLAGQPVIIGSGIAGLVCALELAARRPVVLVTAADAGAQSATRWAQGGMAAAVGADDSPVLHSRDTRAAGDGLTDPAAADWLTRAAPDAVAWLAARGVRFDGGAGGPALGLEAAHSRRRILHAAGDGTGAEIIRALTAALDRHPAITVIAGAQARRLLTRDGRIAGVIAVTATGALTLPATQVVIATGSIGGLYRDATSPGENWGQGLAMAAQAGAALRDLEFVQFHPTALDGPARPMPLISEAVRGEGAVLIDETGTRFADALPGAELAPRDRLARAIAAHLARGHRVFLDATACLGPGFARRFPGIDAICRQAGIDPARQPIPVRPAMHYHMGGIATDLTGRSSLPGLWACGEAACTGLHGANRLASNSLTEAAVLARAVAADIAAQPPAPPLLALTTDDAPPPADPAPARSIVSDHLGLIRDAQGLRHAIAALLPMARGDGPASAPAQLALMMAVAAHDRCESRGAHTRRDHPAAAALARHSTLTLGAALARAADLTPQPLTESA